MGKKSKIIMGLATAAMIPAILTGCGHKEHDPKDEWKTDETYHWHECEESKCDEQLNKAEHEAATVYSHNDTHHWKECTECEYDLSLEQHTFDKEVVESKYLKTEATATTKAVYYKSCICGEKGTETFESGLKIGTISNLAIAGKVYDGTAVNAPTYDKNTDGTATIEYKLKTAADTTYTTVAPINAGEYTARVSIAETANHTSVSETKDFTISKATPTLENVAMSQVNITYRDEYGVQFSTNSDGLVSYKWYQGSNELTDQPINVGNNYKVKVKIAESNNYNAIESELVPFEIAPIILANLNTEVVYNGTLTHTIFFDDVEPGEYEPGLTMVIGFTDKNVGATPTSVKVQVDGADTSNYVVDTPTCVVSIVKKGVQIEWQSNTVPFKFDGSAKLPTVNVADGYVYDGDVVEVEIIANGDNVSAGSTFTCNANENLIGQDGENYYIMGSLTSDEYSIVSMDVLNVGTSETVVVEKDNPVYYAITLDSSKKYYFTFVEIAQDSVIKFELYRIEGGRSILDRLVEWDATTCTIDETSFSVDIAGQYYIKCIAITAVDGYPDEGELTIVEDVHTELDAYGHCEHCGAYQGETESINSNITVTFEGEETLYYRFKIDYNLKHRIVFASGEFNYTAYRVSFAGNDYDADVEKYNTAVEIELDGILKEFEGSDYIYLVITKKGTTSSVTVQLEESSF